MKALFVVEFLKDLFKDLFYFVFIYIINDLPLHITSNTVNCDMSADVTSLNTSDKDTLFKKNYRKA